MSTERKRFHANFPSLQSRQIGSFAHVFIQDIQVGLGLKYRRQNAESDYAISINGSPEEIERANIVLESLDSSSDDIKDRLREAISELLRQLTWNGVAHYEIIREHPSSGDVELSQFSHRNLWRLPWFYLQVVPKLDVAEKGSQRYIWQRSRSIWTIKLPKELGSPASYRRMLNQLDSFNPVVPKYLVSEMANSTDWLHIDTSAYRHALSIYQAKITEKWGWIGRSSIEEITTEFFRLLRRLRLLRSQILLHEQIVKSLNELFARLEIRVQISLHGLPKVVDVEEMVTSLHRGESTFSEAYELTGLRYKQAEA